MGHGPKGKKCHNRTWFEKLENLVGNLRQIRKVAKADRFMPTRQGKGSQLESLPDGNDINAFERPWEG